jgi:hypothetical protein
MEQPYWILIVAPLLALCATIVAIRLAKAMHPEHFGP